MKFRFRFFKNFKTKYFLQSLKIGAWILTGIFLGLFFVSTSIFLIFQRIYKDVVYPGVMVNGINFGGKNPDEIKKFFEEKNNQISNTGFIFIIDKDPKATISAKEIEFGYNGELLAKQSFSIGRSDNILTNIYLISRAYINSINLSASFSLSEKNLRDKFVVLNPEFEKPPVDALFKFENGRVTAFRPSQKGSAIDYEKIVGELQSRAEHVLYEKPREITLPLHIKILEPQVQTEDANDFGIKELIAEGRSLFAHSIQSRIFNITLASSRLNGILVPPGEIFSFDKALGDISAFTGYQQAYIIKDGKTILGDGGGVCQVSTTLFRGLLNAGLPIVERNQHSYRVGYYEQDSLPGFDATIYVPSVDLKFKNDTGSYILIQTTVDPETPSLTFSLYGKKDGREVIISKPLITNQIDPPPPAYQDDPSLPKGQVKQVEFEAKGATVSFTRQVKKNGKIIISDKFVSSYRPWQAVYLRGTRE